LFGRCIRLCPIHEDPPVAGCPRSRAEQRNPFAPAPLQDLPHYYGSLRPCAPHRYSHPHRDPLFGLLPYHRNDRFPRSTRKPDQESRRLHAGGHLGRNQVAPQTRPGLTNSPRFRHHLALFDTSSAVRLRSSLLTSPDRLNGPPFLQRSPPRLFTVAACSGLKPTPDGRLRGTYPHLPRSSASTLRWQPSRHTLIQVPTPLGNGSQSLLPAPPDFRREHRSEPIPPKPHGLVANVDTTLIKQVLDLPQRQGKADIHHHRQTDYLG